MIIDQKKNNSFCILKIYKNSCWIFRYSRDVFDIFCCLLWYNIRIEVCYQLIPIRLLDIFKGKSTLIVVLEKDFLTKKLLSVLIFWYLYLRLKAAHLSRYLMWWRLAQDYILLHLVYYELFLKNNKYVSMTYGVVECIAHFWWVKLLLWNKNM